MSVTKKWEPRNLHGKQKQYKNTYIHVLKKGRVEMLYHFFVHSLVSVGVSFLSFCLKLLVLNILLLFIIIRYDCDGYRNFITS